MKKIVHTLAAFGLGLSLAGLTLTGAASAAEFPIKKPVEQNWSFSGPFGTYDKGQLQRGLKIYREVCASCHSLSLVPFRTLTELGYSEEQVRSLAGQYEVEDGPDDAGDMFKRPATPSDYFPAAYANPQQAAASNNGAIPPDLSLIAKARAVERGFPTFVFDIFTQYAEGGVDYVYSLLTGYGEQTPEGVEVPAGTHYNPHFLGGVSLSMAAPLSAGMIPYEDGTPETVDQYAHDVTAFLMWAAEPHLESRKHTGFMVMIFLLIFAGLVYVTKRKVWSSLH